jgi:hypothetical protein
MNIIRKLALFICAFLLIPIAPLAIIIWTILDCFHENKATDDMVEAWIDCFLWRV